MGPSQVSDADLARALRDAEPDAFEAAWQRFLPLVRGMVRRSVGLGAEGEDIIQEIFLALFRRIRTLREPQALRAFVMAITVRTLMYERRRRHRGSWASLESEDQIEGLRICADSGARQAFMSLQQLVSRLRERDRMVFMMRFGEGLGSDEIGAALGVSGPTARRSLARALERLKLWAGRDPFLADFVASEEL